MHYRIHVQLFGSVGRLALALKHHTACQIDVLIILHGTNFTKRAHEIPWRMHLFHHCSHLRGGLLILFLPMLDILRNTFFVLGLQLFVLQEITCHNPINFLEILQHCESRLLFVSRHVLTQVVVRIDSY